MPRGGKRVGAGRKKSSLGLKTRAIAERAAAEGITPLEVILRTMRSAWARASGNGENVTNFKEALIAAAMAEKAAPYVHPRLAAERHEVIHPRLAAERHEVSGSEPSMTAPP